MSIKLPDALRAVQEAVENYRKLAEAVPDAFLPKLATSLGDLSNYLDESGHRVEADAARREAEAILTRIR